MEIQKQIIYILLLSQKFEEKIQWKILFLESKLAKKEEIEIVMNNFINVYLVIIDNNIFIDNYIKPLKSFFISKSLLQKIIINIIEILIVKTYSYFLFNSLKKDVSYINEDNLRNTKIIIQK